MLNGHSDTNPMRTHFNQYSNKWVGRLRVTMRTSVRIGATFAGCCCSTESRLIFVHILCICFSVVNPTLDNIHRESQCRLVVFTFIQSQSIVYTRKNKAMQLLWLFRYTNASRGMCSTLFRNACSGTSQPNAARTLFGQLTNVHT